MRVLRLELPVMFQRESCRVRSKMALPSRVAVPVKVEPGVVVSDTRALSSAFMFATTSKCPLPAIDELPLARMPIAAGSATRSRMPSLKLIAPD
ncbi:hypothetical protein D9M71_291060 [compost metagenome]